MIERWCIVWVWELTWKDLFPHISCGVRTRSLYMASPCMNSWPGRFVTICITRWSNTELECVKILAVDIDDYFDPKIIIFDQVFNAGLMYFLLVIILGHQVIFPIYIIWSFWRNMLSESPGESEWAECFVRFWVYVYTLVSGVHTVFYKPCWWVYMVEWIL